MLYSGRDLEAPMDGRHQPSARLSAQEFFELLCSLKNQVNCVQDPKGGNLLEFLRTKTGYESIPPVRNKLEELANLGYIRIEKHKNRLFRVKIITPVWDPNLLPGEPVAALQPQGPAPEVRERAFYVFIDWKNLLHGLRREYAHNPKELINRTRNISWLLEPIIRAGRIIAVFAFVPQGELANTLALDDAGVHIQYCPRDRDTKQVVTKDKDTADSRLDELARTLVNASNSQLTDVVIVSGDADFVRLISWLQLQGKTVHVVSTYRAISGRILAASNVNVRLIENDKPLSDN